MTVREHLKKAHSAMAEHHRKMAGLHDAMVKAAKESMNGEANFHKSAAAAHNAAAESHDSMCAECEKAAGDVDLNKVVPDRVSAVVPNAGVRAVPRTGQRDLSDAPVDPMFADLVKVDESL
jgi:hypothetical protein